MYKLTIISGPNRGTTYSASEGEVSFGRQAGNTVVLASSKVSKKHCVLEIKGEAMVVKDLGSSNGTFVNGILTKSRIVGVGDRIGVGEFVFELSKPIKKASPPAGLPHLGGLGHSNQFPGQKTGFTPPTGFTNPGMSGIPQMGSIAAPNGPPKDVLGKISWFFENQFMPFFYGMNTKYEWRMICLALMAVFIVGNLLISVYPIIDASRVTIITETKRRALFMAKQIADRSAPFLAAKAETKTDTAGIEDADGVRTALLVDLDNRIIAPAAKLNQYLSSGAEARIAVQARDLFRAGRETGFARETEELTVVAVEPVKVLNAALGKNVIVAMSVVSIDTTLYTPDLGEMGVTYSQTLILTGILAGFILLVLHRLTLKPYLTLNEDMDKALKGDIPQVTHPYKVSEVNSLWEIINAAVQRIPKSDSPGSDAFGGGGGGGPGIEEYLGPLRAIGNLIKVGLIVFDTDRKIVHMNALFEEISGIRSENAVGHDISEVARDQAMGSFTADILGRATSGDDGVSEDFEISGMPYKMHACAFGAVGGSPRCYLMLALRPEE